MQAKTLASSFVNSQFNYCAIVWMFCSRKSKPRLENTRKRALRDESVVKLPGFKRRLKKHLTLCN